MFLHKSSNLMKENLSKYSTNAISKHMILLFSHHVHVTTLEFFNVKFYLTLCTYMRTLSILYICKEILPPLDNVEIEFHWIMVLKIEDASLPNQVPKDETID